MNAATTSSRPSVEIADIIRQHGASFLQQHQTSFAQRRVLRDLARCRTAELGGHVHRCDGCAHEQIAYNSCRNRHCPKCQGSTAAQWMQDRSAELLDAPYFHLVFTLPDSLAGLALQNPRIVYGALFQAASKTLLEVAANPKHLGAKIGFLAVLHTWGQNLHHHPHVHCVVPAGGISPCQTKWIKPKSPDFFLPVRVLSRVFRGKFIALLKKAKRQGKLTLVGRLEHLQDNDAWEQRLNESVRKEWVVYAKAPFGGPQVVLKYLSRYTHRVAISNARLHRLKEGKITFGVKDYANGGGRTTHTLTAEEFLRRFLLHVLPKGFMRIRHFGFLANRFRAKLLQRCRVLIGMEANRSASSPPIEPVVDPTLFTPPIPAAQPKPCPACGVGSLVATMIAVQRIDPPHLALPRRPANANRFAAETFYWNTS